MHLNAALECVASFPKSEDLTQFVHDIAPEWIEEALAATGTATLRRRRLPMEQVPWLVIGMALLRGRPVTAVVNKLDLAMPSPTKPTVARSAVVQARDRLGESPMAWLFIRCADQWAHQSAARARWRGLSLYGVDGTTLRVPDTEGRQWSPWSQRVSLSSSGGLDGAPVPFAGSGVLRPLPGTWRALVCGRSLAVPAR